jgi:phage gp46-like protein
MGQNTKFDPVKRDYVAEQGSVGTTDDIRVASYFVLKKPKGKWLYGAPGEGSDLHKFQNSKRLSNTEQLFAARSNEAIQSQLIDTGRAEQVTTTNIDSSREGSSNEIEVVPLQADLSDQFEFTPV